MRSFSLGNPPDRPDDQRDTREVNEALIAMSVRQHELVEEADQARREAEALSVELRASEERFRALINASSDVVYRMNADWTEMRHLRGRDFILDTTESSRTWLEKYIHPDDQSRVMKAIREAIRTKSVFELEHRVLRVDGTLGWTISRAVPQLDAAGEILEWLGAASDITDRKQVELALQESETFNRGVFESSPDCVKVLDSEGRLLRMNTNGLCVMEIDDFAPLAGCRWWDLWPLEGRAELLATLKVARAGGAGRFHGHCPTAKGTDKWWDVNVAAIRDADGNVANFIAVSRDITDRVQAEHKLRESEQRFRMVADNITQLAWTCDKLGNVTWYNQRWLEYTGMGFEEVKGWDWSKVQHPDHLDRVVGGVKRSAETGEPWEDTFPLRRKDGLYRWFLSQAVPIRDETGKITRWFGTNTDVTELREAQQDLREADRRKSEFLAMLAHELRNPLAPIRNGVQMLRLAENNAETVRSMSEMMDRQVGQMVRLVDDLLDASRINQGKIELRRVRVELASIVQQAIEAARPMVESADHQLTVILPPGPVSIDADPTRLAQVVGNLLTNACKFTDKGGSISLTLELARRATTGHADEAVISVRDSGIGIAADQLPRIFDMFMQVDTSLGRTVSGLGIGLTLVKNLVELHGGTVEVRSSGLGHGSEFVVHLPILVEIPKQPPTYSTVSGLQNTKTRRILVVDDNRDSAKTLAMLLKLTGNATRTAHDGLEAVEVTATFKPDVVLLDIGLPKLDGYEACRRIRQEPWGKSIMLVALTGWGQDEDRKKSRDAGFNAHLVKPIDFADLTKLLGESDV